MHTSSCAPVSWLNRFSLRASILYLLIYGFPFPFDLLPFMAPVGAVCLKALIAVGRIVLQLAIGFHDPIPTAENGSGDRLDLWVAQVGILFLALVGGAVWAAFAPGAAMQTRLTAAARFYLRYILAGSMLSYGVIKLSLSQFPAPSVDRLIQPLGESSPMGLLWTMIGLSPAYQFIGGLLETIAGLLLLSRRTTPLGAFLMAGVMANVAILNYCYDVPVKMYSTQLLLGALVLAAPHVPGLLNLLARGRPAAPAEPAIPLAGWRRWALSSWNVVFAIGVFITSSLGQTDPAPPDLAATYEVVSFKRDGFLVPNDLGDPHRWRYFTLGRYGGAIIRSVGGVRSRYDAEVDFAAKKIKLTATAAAPEITDLSYIQPTPDTLVITAKQAGTALEVELRRRRADEFLIINRGFHWINPAPFNR